MSPLYYPCPRRIFSIFSRYTRQLPCGHAEIFFACYPVWNISPFAPVLLYLQYHYITPPSNLLYLFAILHNSGIPSISPILILLVVKQVIPQNKILNNSRIFTLSVPISTDQCDMDSFLCPGFFLKLCHSVLNFFALFSIQRVHFVCILHFTEINDTIFSTDLPQLPLTGF